MDARFYRPSNNAAVSRELCLLACARAFGGCLLLLLFGEGVGRVQLGCILSRRFVMFDVQTYRGFEMIFWDFFGGVDLFSFH